MITIPTYIILFLCLAVFFMIFIAYTLFVLKSIKHTQGKHLEFLLKVKHDLPILATQIEDLYEQISIPENENDIQ